MTVNEKIAAIRQKMVDNNIDAVMIPSSDPHMSEYPSDHWKTRAYISGFSGSAGTLVITREMSGLWTDGRYYVQAAKELEGTETVLFRASNAETPSINKYLMDNLAEGSVIGLNGRLFSTLNLNKMRTEFSEKGMTVDLNVDYGNELWEADGRPADVFTPAFELSVVYTGKSTGDKLAELRKKLAGLHADALLINKLDNISWLLNIRSTDVENNPVVISYAYITSENAYLFTDQSRIPAELGDTLRQNGVTLMGYEEIYDFIAKTDKPAKVLCDEKALNSVLWDLAEKNDALTIVPGTDPIFMMKAVKNCTENANTMNAYRKDGCAFAEFYGWLFEELEKGTELTEYDCAEKLRNYRSQQPLNRGESFGAIVAYGPNAAMMHYAPKANDSAKIERHGLLLIDSGGQYLDGTTDTTRTFAMGPISEKERHDFTLVLQGSLALILAKFPHGTTGYQLDTLCRMHFWQEGLNYRCGTGHGVGFMLNVHEGPVGYGQQTVSEAGMNVTIEPGIYREGEHGIRTENCVKVVEGELTEYGQMLEYEMFTRVPIDITSLDPSIMTEKEIAWLNDYHQKVWNDVSPYVSERARKWLKKYTAPISR